MRNFEHDINHSKPFAWPGRNAYAPGHRAVWATDTDGQAGASLRVQDDGNLVIYTDGEPHWAAGTNNPDKRPIEIQAAKQRMDLHLKISRTGIIESERYAAIKKTSGTFKHYYWFTLLDENENTLWVSPVETLTLGAVVIPLGKPVNVSKDDSANYTIHKSIVQKTWSAVIYMKQVKSGAGDPIKQLEDLTEKFKKIDKAYKEVKNSELGRDLLKAASGAGAID